MRTWNLSPMSLTNFLVSSQVSIDCVSMKLRVGILIAVLSFVWKSSSKAPVTYLINHILLLASQ